jgi:rubrerythrin
MKVAEEANIISLAKVIKDDEPKEVKEGKDEEEEEEEIDEKKCDEEDEEEEEEIDEGLNSLLSLGYELVESNLDLYVCEDCGHLHESAGECEECGGNLEEAMKLVVKNGKVVKKKVNNKKKKMSAKQKQALKKAQKASQKGDAKKKRVKSMKLRAKKGLDEGAEEFECPQCGYIGDMEEVEKGVFLCPDCDAELEIDGQVLREELDESKDDILDVYKKALDIPEFIINEGNDLVKKYLKDVFDIDLD